MQKRICIVDGVRTPMSKSGGSLRHTRADELAVYTVIHLLQKLALDAERIDEVIFGNVSMPIEAANIGRVISLKAGIPNHIPGYTVQRNCASGMESILSAARKIQLDEGELFIAGGTESMSNIPLIYNYRMMSKFRRLMTRSVWKKIRALLSIQLSFEKPIIGLEKGLTDPVSGLIMGQTAELLARMFNISREEQDEFALWSYKKYFNAKAQHRFVNEVVPVPQKPDYNRFVTEDEGIREDQSYDALARLRPYFDRVDGTVTVGNSCAITDGAASVLVTSEDTAERMGLNPLGYITDYSTAGLAPSIMGLGPIHACNTLFEKTKSTIDDYDLIEMNEAFAAQVIANERAFASNEFAREHLGRKTALGSIDRNKLNVNGGAIAMGHPVGMTGTRIILHTLKELRRRKQKKGLATLCVGGGQGCAVALEAA